MRRYSEIPNTPTPFSKISNELKVGSLLTITGTGRAILRYVGPVQNKSGKFAGIELLGDSAMLGKNSGAVDGIEYFKTKYPGSGLFMSYDKLLNSIDYVESPPTKRFSLMSSPSVACVPTPSRKRQSMTPGSFTHSRSVSKRNSTTGPHSTTPSSISTSSQTRNSPSYEELKRLQHAKSLVENEKNKLVQETEVLNYEIDQLKSILTDQERSIKDLELSHRRDQDKLKGYEEKLSKVEAKLTKQKTSYEEQRDELLDVIDQLEDQVTDNEKLYIGELQKLQEELKHKDNELSSSGSNYFSDKSVELNSVRLTDFEKQVEQLMSEKKEGESLIADLKIKLEDAEQKTMKVITECLELKESAIADQKKHEDKLKLIERELSNAEEDDKIKERVIEKLRIMLKTFNESTETTDESLVEKLQKEIFDLKDQVKGTENYVNENTKLQEEIKSLTQQLQSNSDTDKIIELESILKYNEQIIKGLKKELTNAHEATSNAKENSKSIHDEELERLKEGLETKDNIIEEKELMFQELENIKGEYESLKSDFASKVKALEETEAGIKKINDSRDNGSREKEVKEASIVNVEDKDREILSLRETMSDLQQQLKELKFIDKKKSVIEHERAELDKCLAARDTELVSLKKKLEKLKTKSSDGEIKDEYSIGKEKDLEIEILKEELLRLKSKENYKEAEAVKKELSDIKGLNLATTNKELSTQLQLLEEELSSRPTVDELQEVRSELELIDELRKAESKDRQKEINKLQILLTESSIRLTDTTKKLTDSAKKENRKSDTTPTKRDDSPSKSHIFSHTNDRRSSNQTTQSTLSLNRPSVISQVVDGALQIYVPETKDPTNGRKLWCGLCEREGHDSIDCPFENDVF